MISENPDPQMNPHGISQDDQRHLDELEKKFRLIRDYTRSVATGRSPGLYLYGSGGCGKSHNVIEELELSGVPYKLYNSRMTGRGLYNALERFPDSIHLLEDMEQLFRDSGARGVLRSALWSQSKQSNEGPQERLITWSTQVMEHSFIFTGGLIMTANRPFPDVPELHAVKTRIAYVHLSVSDNEIIAMMRKISLAGFQSGPDQLEPHECREVCNHIVRECMGMNRTLDLRMFVNSLSDYAMWRDCQTSCDWRDLVSAQIKERPTHIMEAKSIDDRRMQKVDELKLAEELLEIGDLQQQVQIWHEKTGKSRASLYRRRKELKEGQ